MTSDFSRRISGVQPSAIREIFKVLADPGVISLAAGSPSPETFPAAELAAVSSELFAQRAGAALQYGITEGYGPLREQTAARLRDKYRVGGPDDDLIITTGGQQGLDLTAKVLLNEGDTVLCEEPSFIGALNCLRATGARLVGVPADEGGMDMEALARALKSAVRPKLIYTIPTFQNPGGTTLSAPRREQMLALARQYNVLVAEDDPYFELRYTGQPVPALKSLDEEGRVIYLGSYSKTISPGLRLGFVCAHRDIVSKMIVAKQVSDVHTNLFFQMAVSLYLDRYDFDAHIAACRALYAGRLDRMYAHVNAWGDRVSCLRPEGGLFLWCRLPRGYDGAALCRLAGARKVAAVPGSAFAVREDEISPGFRLNFSLPTDEQITQGMILLTQALEELLETTKN
ncbi:MAG: PLP-dependent aminotransferase family protein [Oscillospiraceae bacterium]|jgi:2-aminoadipate transaminase|nr:PLP-dependent aminotransferase family protein [Oscillospiraceae bacterium]